MILIMVTTVSQIYVDFYFLKLQPLRGKHLVIFKLCPRYAYPLSLSLSHILVKRFFSDLTNIMATKFIPSVAVRFSSTCFSKSMQILTRESGPQRQGNRQVCRTWISTLGHASSFSLTDSVVCLTGLSEIRNEITVTLALCQCLCSLH